MLPNNLKVAGKSSMVFSDVILADCCFPSRTAARETSGQPATLSLSLNN